MSLTSYAYIVSYHNAVSYILSKTPVVELYNLWGGRVAVCPQWNGRVMTSTCDGLDGTSFGFINVRKINANIEDSPFSYYGGEDQFTFSPTTGGYAVTSTNNSEVSLRRTFQTADAAGKLGQFELQRTVSLLDRDGIALVFGEAVDTALNRTDVSAVGFYTANVVQSETKALVSGRLRGMFNATPHTVAVIPYLPNDPYDEESSLATNFFGGAPNGRIRHLLQTLLIRADGAGRCQISTLRSWTASVWGMIEFQTGSLTLWSYELPMFSDEDSVRFYNHGATHPGEQSFPRFYEADILASPQELYPDESLKYSQYTLHLSADNTTLAHLVKNLFGAGYEQIYDKMLRYR
jgi:hypothetical protein